MSDDQQVYPFQFYFDRSDGGATTVADAGWLQSRLSSDQQNIHRLFASSVEVSDQEIKDDVSAKIDELFFDAFQAIKSNSKEEIKAALRRVYDPRFSLASESDAIDRVRQLIDERMCDIALHMLQQVLRRNSLKDNPSRSAQVELAVLEVKSYFSELRNVQNIHSQLAECYGLANKIYSFDVGGLIKENQEKVDAYKKVVYESVGVGAVRKYWNDKSSQLGCRYKLMLTAISAVVIVLLAWFVCHFGDVSAWVNTLRHDQSSQLIAILPVTLMAGVAIWLLRIFVKLMMSSYYLAEDASVRVVMIDTLIALLAEEKTDKNAQALLLHHVFSPPSFGDQSSGVDIPLPALLESLRK
ncbi:hypothetical protein EV699_1325 [Plasticicumulans lactativorans]|uniref:DUF6161 domain-containing protein n=1 Tax=Plasticicumulans lactativorans TaxID=1133106 RepID=A0A4R2KQ19_9GAMM|nr:DUF6161 domain-containing protein [Plasticicumulans lactativorans]TCO76341.1 hypothetical protein EV699_1325 [Plasticicumulans lactativorans]